MKETWNKYAARIDALVLRERLMVFGAAILVSVYLVFVLFIEPAQKREKLLASQMRQQQTELQNLQQQAQLLGKRLSDPDEAARTRRPEARRGVGVNLQRRAAAHAQPHPAV